MFSNGDAGTICSSTRLQALGEAQAALSFAYFGPAREPYVRQLLADRRLPRPTELRGGRLMPCDAERSRLVRLTRSGSKTL